MFVVGLTGGIGSGKSTVAEGFARLGVPVIDTDAIAHALTAPHGDALPAIRARFGAGVFDAHGELDRKALRQIVFGDAEARRALEAILHPRIRAAVERQLADHAAAPYVLLVVPLLIETDAYRETVQRVLVVVCPEAVRVARVMARSGLARSEVAAIVAAQASDAQRRARADDVIDNAGEPAALDAKVATLHGRYLSLAGASPEP